MKKYDKNMKIETSADSSGSSKRKERLLYTVNRHKLTILFCPYNICPNSKPYLVTATLFQEVVFLPSFEVFKFNLAII